MPIDTSVLLDGLFFPEGPRWREGKLWFSDMHARQVMTVDLDGKAEKVVEVAGRPSGLGWLPDGRLLVVSMTDRRLLRLDPDGLKEVANLKELASFHCNDMVVDLKGRAYIGNFGFDEAAKAPFKPAEIVMVTPNGQACVAADGLAFPNGTVITPDGNTLIVGETYAGRLTAFDITPDGSLVNRRVWAQLEGDFPDGICLDAEGAVWVASPVGTEVLRVREGGEVTHRLKASNKVYACMLGGPERRTLFALTANSSNPQEVLARASGRIEVVEVAVPGDGLP
ncbi:MAG: SMP-30/gluconolactonase/LRE family protein [Deltaproteobacteria bacterium]|nr:SMP-30/gluconolactonase/LRE family protein [Deltaproteobacteria bacterium]